jgi:hypothetical protein
MALGGRYVRQYDDHDPGARHHDHHHRDALPLPDDKHDQHHDEHLLPAAAAVQLSLSAALRISGRRVLLLRLL